MKGAVAPFSKPSIEVLALPVTEKINIEAARFGVE
jgi:hypothetical protein